jgi:hypothetical protein
LLGERAHVAQPAAALPAAQHEGIGAETPGARDDEREAAGAEEKTSS